MPKGPTGNPRGRPVQPLTAKQELFMRMSARGESRKDILFEVFGVDTATATEQEIHRCDQAMSRWKKLPQFPEIWRDEVDRILLKHAGKAIKTTAKLLDREDQPWLQLNAANSILNYSRPRVFGDEQSEVKVVISGMPDLGTPDEETDSPADDG